MTRSLLSAALILLAVPTSFAQTPPPPGSLNTWVEACEAEEAAPDLQALLAHEVAIVPVESIVHNLNGTFSVVHEPFVEIFGGGTLCSNAPFYGEPRVEYSPFRSAVQVGEDLVLTAWHGAFAPQFLGSYVVVTGLRSGMVGDTCVPAAFDGLDGSRLFALTEVVADGEPTPTGGGIDFLLLRVDRPISATYPRVRRSGRGQPGDSVTSIGHPERMAARVDVGGTAGRVGPFLPFPWEALEVANVHLLHSNSGGMLYNRTQRLVETVARTNGNAFYTPAGQTDPDCWTIVHQDGWSAVNASLRHFAGNIPAFELIVDDLDPVVNVATGGGPLPNPSHSRTVGAPSTAHGPIAYQIVPPPPFTPGEPTLLITPGGPLSGTLAPGTGFTVQEQAHIHGVTCGRFEKSYVVRDLTNGFDDVARHQFEISLREFTVAPEGTQRFADIALPFEETVAYTVHNPREETVTVVVGVDQSWARVRQPGGAGPAPSIEVTLDPGESAQVVLDVVGPLEPETFPHTYTATLTFDFEDGTPCPAFTEPVTRQFVLVYGKETFSGPAPFAIPDAPARALQVSLPITEPFCIGDLNVFVHTIDVPAYHIEATLKGPLHGPLTLWNQGVLQGDRPLKGLFDDEGVGNPDRLQPVQPLSTFDGLPGHVTWRLDLGDRIAGDQGSLDAWSLQFTAAHCPN